MLNIHDIAEKSEIYGPGQRMVIWFQGCGIQCPECWNPEMWPMEPNQLFTVEVLIDKIQQVKGIEGVTYIGGEPMHQCEELLQLSKRVKELGLTIVLFTGFELEELNLLFEKELLSLCDIIVSGRYQHSERDMYLQWRGSRNQKVIFNTNRYQDYCMINGNYCEIEIDDFGVLSISGFPDEEIRKLFIDQ